MRCYTHSDTDAVAICQHCGKALCRTCTTAVGTKMSCHGDCEKEVENTNMILKRGKQNIESGNVALRSNAKSYYATGLLIVLAGTIFLISGFKDQNIFQVKLLCWGLGFIFFGTGFYMYILGNRIIGSNDRNK
jgi:hypothetical protein